MSVLASEPIERRRYERTTEGRYVLRVDPCDGQEPLTCRVWDISLSGARLTLPHDVTLPAEVTILIGNVTHRARVVWQKKAHVGLEFIEAAVAVDEV